MCSVASANIHHMIVYGCMHEWFSVCYPRAASAVERSCCIVTIFVNLQGEVWLLKFLCNSFDTKCCTVYRVITFRIVLITIVRSTGTATTPSVTTYCLSKNNFSLDKPILSQKLLFICSVFALQQVHTGWGTVIIQQPQIPPDNTIQ